MYWNFINDLFSNTDYVLLMVFGLCSFILLLYYWLVFAKLSFGKRKNSENTTKRPVSVVICARNEFENLQKNLPLILNQEYPKFEVVVVNDNSNDDTALYLRTMAENNPKLNIVNINSSVTFFSGKKFPLSIGIKSAKYEHLLLTDADCEPASPYWIDQMQQAFYNKKNIEIVLGYGTYENRPSLLNALVHYDTLHTGIQYLSYAMKRMPYMGVGRNLAYTKKLFFHNGGFVSHYTIPSGDDDLFINRVATRNNCQVVINQEAQTISEAPLSFAEWLNQKKRHLSTCTHYKGKSKFMLGTYNMCVTLFYILTIVVLLSVYSNLKLLLIAAGIFMLKTVSQWIVMGKGAKVLQEKRMAAFIPIYDAIFAVLNPIFLLKSILSRKTTWK